jgi:RND family efflux transporter MFP subunit
MKTIMKQHYLSRLMNLGLLIMLWISPVSPVFAFEEHRFAPAQKTVTASAVVVPAQTYELGFLISGIAREVPIKEGDAVRAGQTLIVLDTPELQFAVAEAQAALRSAQAEATVQSYRRVKSKRNGKVFYDAVPAEARQRIDAKVQQAQVALELAQINFAEATLTAPSDAVVASIHAMPGEFVPSDQAVITLATLDNLQLETTDLSERDITQVKLGAPVQINVEALGSSFRGRVVSISPVADTVGGDVIFKVTIAFEEQPQGLRWGMTAEVQIGK